METVLLYIVGVLVVAVGIALSIGLHEIGHLVPAKKFGVKVGQYMIGFGPTIWSRKYGETQYGIKAIPFGGYISMAGMFPPAKTKTKTLANAQAPARSATTGIFNVLVQDARDASAQTVLEGEEDRVFYKLAFWKRIIIMLGGPTMNLLIAIVLYGVVLCGFGIPVATTTIGSVSECIGTSTSQTSCGPNDPAAPAAAAGLKPGDRIISIDGLAITSWDDETAAIRKAPGQTLDFVIERDGQQRTLQVTPVESSVVLTDSQGNPLTNSDGTNRTEKAGFIGIGPASKVTPQPVTAVLPQVGDNIVRVGQIIIDLPHRLIQVGQAAFGGQKRDPNGPVSVVGVGRLAGEIATLNSVPVADRISSMIGIVASLNVALFVFNLIPLLPLDGGHVIGAVWEALRRRFAKWFRRPDPGPVDMAKLIPLTLAVVAILGVSSALLVYADIVNPISIQ